MKLDSYEFHKLKALRGSRTTSTAADPMKTLQKAYEMFFTADDVSAFREQSKALQLDRIDLTFLLLLRYPEGNFVRDEEYFIQKKNFEIVRKKKIVSLSYTLTVVDEVQNYLPEQIALLRSCVSDKTKSMLYVGDLAQQVLLGTLHRWEDAGEVLPDDRKVALEKVYRSTKQILLYVKHLGFPVMVPEGLREGAEVVEMIGDSLEDEVDWIREQLLSDTGAQIGILGFDENTLAPFREAFKENAKVHILTVHQSQGVEFDTVYLVGIHQGMFEDRKEMDENLAAERAKIQRDLIYVGLTRAMDKLSIVGSRSLKSILHC